MGAQSKGQYKITFTTHLTNFQLKQNIQQKQDAGLDCINPELIGEPKVSE